MIGGRSLPVRTCFKNRVRRDQGNTFETESLTAPNEDLTATDGEGDTSHKGEDVETEKIVSINNRKNNLRLTSE